MKVKRWTLGVVLAAAVSVFGLMEADASPFATYLLSDDIGNQVLGSAAEAGDWGSEDGNGNGNNGHGNNEDGVDSSNQGNSKADEDTNCDGDGNCVDDEMGTGDSGNDGNNGNNGNNGKKKKK